MSEINRVSIQKSNECVQFVKAKGNGKGADGKIKIASLLERIFGAGITIDGNCFNKGSVIDFLNKNSGEKPLAKGKWGVGGAKDSEIEAVYRRVVAKMPNNHPKEAKYLQGMDLYSSGKTSGNSEDVKKAFWIFSNAAQGNHPGALFQLGHMYETGEGYGKIDIATAIFYYKAAAAQGNRDAQDGIRRLEGVYSDDIEDFDFIPSKQHNPDVTEDEAEQHLKEYERYWVNEKDDPNNRP